MMSLKNYEKEEKETRGDKGGQGKANNTPSEKTPNGGEGSSPQNIIPTKPPGITETVGAGHLARSPRANGQVSGADGGGPPATQTAWDSAAADPLQFTSWLGKGPGTQNFSILTPAQERGVDNDDGQRQGNSPRDNGEIHFTRNKEKGIDKFDGKATEHRPWRRRMTNYVTEENASYAKLMEWARTQRDVIYENPHDFGGTESI